jgi:hypothetical protein
MLLGHDVVVEAGCNWYLRDIKICSLSEKNMSRELVEDQTKINNQQKKPEGSQLPRLWHVLCKPLRDVAKKRDDAKVDNLNFFKH